MSTADLKQRLTTFLFPSLLLVFVALYVTSLASGATPELALLRSGGAGVVLAVLGRVALGIVNDEETLAINELALLEQTMAAEALAAAGSSANGALVQGELATPTAGQAPSDASAQTDAPTGFIPTPLGARPGASTVQATVRGEPFGGQE